MKILISIIFITLTTVVVLYSLNTKKKYDTLRDTLGAPLKTVTMSTEIETLYYEAQNTWREQFNVINGPDSEAMELLNLKPTVTNWVNTVTYILPEYKFGSLNKNKDSVRTAMTRNLIAPISIDNSIHLSKDGHIALIRIKEGSIFVLSDENSDIRSVKYELKIKQIEP